MSSDATRPGTTEHAQLVRGLVERHAGERGRTPNWAVCQICGRLGSAKGYAQGMARSSGPAGRHCDRHGSQQQAIVAAYEHPDRYCPVCATTVGPDPSAPRRLCAGCAPVWETAPPELISELEWLRGVARNPRRRGELGALLRLVEHPSPRFEPLTAARVACISAGVRRSRRRMQLVFLTAPFMDSRTMPRGSPEALARIAELEELRRIDPEGDLVAAGEREDPLGLRPFVREG